MEPPKEPGDVLFGGVVVEDFVDQPPEAVVIHDRQHAVGAVVPFVGGDVAGEIGQSLIQVLVAETFFGPFFPPPPPSSEW